GAQVHAALSDGGPVARIDSLTFGISEPAQAQAQARAAAFADARRRAEQYADLAGRTLGAVVQVVEGGAEVIPVPRARVMAASASMPVEGGEQSVSASVRVHWAWADAAEA
ncbi:MAG TPA: SIMPL domain-containing protein, partial [Candidatus Nanopelagicales bacterium]|nr:SIMPL domain-containing protein [Candidatus Nanopelagicales bacterium]